MAAKYEHKRKLQDSVELEICRFEGCSKPRFAEKRSNGSVFLHQYCGITHAKQYRQVNSLNKSPNFEENTDDTEQNDIELAIKLSLKFQSQDSSVKIQTCLLCSQNVGANNECQSQRCRDPFNQGWNCDLCTFKNELSSTACEMCATAKRENFQSPSCFENMIGSSSSIDFSEMFQDGKMPLLNEVSDEEFNVAIANSLSESYQFPLPPKPPKLNTFEDDLSVAIGMSIQASEEIKDLNHQTKMVDNQLSRKWLCENCEAEHHNSKSLCKQCDEPRVIEWMCKNCTFHNPPSDSHCSMCGKPSDSRLLFGHVTNTSTCGLLDCHRAALHYGFCQESHRKIAIERRVLPSSEPGVDRVFIGATGDYTAHLLVPSHTKYISVNRQFLQFWQKDDGKFPGTVERIYWIRVNPVIQSTFEEVVKTVGNVRRRFHGTSQSPNCHFGVDPACPPCSGEDCSVCSICRNSFDIKRAGTARGRQLTGFSRYGPGIYFARASGKSNDYNELSAKSKDNKTWKSMFLCNVALGNQFITSAEHLTLDKYPPVGTDSITGVKGGGLNYSENVIYDGTHAVPAYLIVYSSN